MAKATDAEPEVPEETTADAQEEQVVQAAPSLTSRNSQARYDAVRRERKARAAVTVKKNAADAKKARDKALAKVRRPDGAAAFEKRAKQIETQMAKRREAK
jgi:hypothetical protein